MPPKTKKSKFEISYGLSDISLEDQYIKPYDSNNTANLKDSQYHCSGETTLDENNNLIKVHLTYEFWNDKVLLLKQKFLHEYKIFKVNNSGLMKANSDKNFIKHLITISIHHSRGMQALLLKDTYLKSFYIPLDTQVDISPRDSDGQSSSD